MHTPPVIAHSSGPRLSDSSTNLCCVGSSEPGSHGGKEGRQSNLESSQCFQACAHITKILLIKSELRDLFYSLFQHEVYLEEAMLALLRTDCLKGFILLQNEKSSH